MEPGEFDVVTSPPLLAELKRALEYGRVKKHLKQPWKTVTDLLKRLETVATVVAPHPPWMSSRMILPTTECSSVLS